MTDINSKLAALRSATKVSGGQAVIKPTKATGEDKIEVQPLPVTVLTAKAFTGNEKLLYSSDPQIEAKLKVLAAELGTESKLGNFTTALFRVDQAIAQDPAVITQLSVDAIKLYCAACKRLVADPSGAKHVEQLQMKLKDQRADELLRMTAEGGSDEEFDFV